MPPGPVIRNLGGSVHIWGGDNREVKMHVISDVTRKFSSRYLLARRKINASDLLLTSKFGVLRQI